LQSYTTEDTQIWRSRFHIFAMAQADAPFAQEFLREAAPGRKDWYHIAT
jgi:hypothetical protein